MSLPYLSAMVVECPQCSHEHSREPRCHCGCTLTDADFYPSDCDVWLLVTTDMGDHYYVHVDDVVTVEAAYRSKDAAVAARAAVQQSLPNRELGIIGLRFASSAPTVVSWVEASSGSNKPSTFDLLLSPGRKTPGLTTSEWGSGQWKVSGPAADIERFAAQKRAEQAQSAELAEQDKARKKLARLEAEAAKLRSQLGGDAAS